MQEDSISCWTELSTGISKSRSQKMPIMWLANKNQFVIARSTINNMRLARLRQTSLNSVFVKTEMWPFLSRSQRRLVFTLLKCKLFTTRRWRWLLQHLLYWRIEECSLCLELMRTYIPFSLSTIKNGNLMEWS